VTLCPRSPEQAGGVGDGYVETVLACSPPQMQQAAGAIGGDASAGVHVWKARLARRTPWCSRKQALMMQTTRCNQKRLMRSVPTSYCARKERFEPSQRCLEVI